MHDIVIAEFYTELQKIATSSYSGRLLVDKPLYLMSDEELDQKIKHRRGERGLQTALGTGVGALGGGLLGAQAGGGKGAALGAGVGALVGGGLSYTGNKLDNLLNKREKRRRKPRKRGKEKTSNINFARSIGGNALMGAGVGGAAGATAGASEGGVGGAVRGGLVGAGLGAAAGAGMGRVHAGNLRDVRRGKMVTQRATQDTAARLGGGDNALERAKALLDKGTRRVKAEKAAKGSLEGTEDYDRLYQPFWGE